MEDNPVVDLQVTGEAAQVALNDNPAYRIVADTLNDLAAILWVTTGAFGPLKFQVTKELVPDDGEEPYDDAGPLVLTYTFTVTEGAPDA